MLDERLLATPAIAVEQTRVLAADMAKLVRKSVQAAIALLGNYSEKGYNEVAKLEKEADNYEDEFLCRSFRMRTAAMLQKFCIQ